MARLRQNTRRFKTRALDSLKLSIELFNRPSEDGRLESVLILLHHAFEMLLKAKIWQERGTVCEPGERLAHRFTKCVAIAHSDLNVMDDDDATGARILNGLRDSATHSILSLSEESFYVHVQAGVTLFARLLDRCFAENIAQHMPNRVLPVSTSPPTDINVFMDKEFNAIRTLVAPGRRQVAEAAARVRPLLIMEAELAEKPDQQPSWEEIAHALRRLKAGDNWRLLFPGVASLRLDTGGSGLTFSVRFTREKAAPAVRRLRPDEDVEDATPYREINLLDTYSMGPKEIAGKLGLTIPKMRALAKCLDIYEREGCYREFSMGKVTYKRYSPAALSEMRLALPTKDMDEVWRKYRA